MDRFLLAAAVVVVAALVALAVQRRRPEAPSQGAAQGSAWGAPTQLDRDDFARPAAPWLVAVFTSTTCDSCAQAVARAQVLTGEEVAVEELPVQTSSALHRRYRIDAVPTTVVADVEGVVRASFHGPPSAADLWATLARVRDGEEGDRLDHGPAAG